MPIIELFMLAETATAAMLAAGFLTAFFFDRSLVVFKWWALFYALISLHIGTSELRFENHSMISEGVAWTCLFLAIASAAHGTPRGQGAGAELVMPISVCAALLAVTMAALVLVHASPTGWAVGGAAPSLALILWISLQRLGSSSSGFQLRAGSLLLLAAGTALIAVRAVWFAQALELQTRMPLESRPPNVPPPPDFQAIDHAFLLSVTSILVMVGLAIVLTLRVTLSEMGRMRKRSSTDALSGLHNRASFDDEAEQVLRKSSGRNVSVVLLDIDFFKRVNDTHGHAAGDAVIARFGEVMAEMTEARQIAGRIGGEEFAAILPDADLASARLYANTLRTRIAAEVFSEQGSFSVTVSAGIAQRRDGEPLHGLIARADKALYAAKNSGRNRVMVAGIEIEEEARPLSA